MGVDAVGQCPHSGPAVAWELPSWDEGALSSGEELVRTSKLAGKPANTTVFAQPRTPQGRVRAAASPPREGRVCLMDTDRNSSQAGVLYRLGAASAGSSKWVPYGKRTANPSCEEHSKGTVFHKGTHYSKQHNSRG